MKISFFQPREARGTNWQNRIAIELKKLNYEVLINECDKECDVAILYSWSRWIDFKNKNKFNIPYITYIWDWFEHINKKNIWCGGELMKTAIEVWAPSNNTINAILKDIPELGKKIIKIPGYFEPEEWKEPFDDKKYILMASVRRFYKRFDFFEKGCNELQFPYISSHPNPTNYKRLDYIEILKNCSILVSCSTTEGFGITPVEGAYCKKPLLLTDIPVFRELWKENAIYFEKDSLKDFKDKLKKMWNKELISNIEGAYQNVLDNFLPDKIAQKIDKRLKKIK